MIEVLVDPTEPEAAYLKTDEGLYPLTYSLIQYQYVVHANLDKALLERWVDEHCGIAARTLDEILEDGYVTKELRAA